MARFVKFKRPHVAFLVAFLEYLLRNSKNTIKICFLRKIKPWKFISDYMSGCSICNPECLCVFWSLYSGKRSHWLKRFVFDIFEFNCVRRYIFYGCLRVWCCRSRRNLCTSLQQQAKLRHNFLQVNVREKHALGLLSLPLGQGHLKLRE